MKNTCRHSMRSKKTIRVGMLKVADNLQNTFICIYHYFLDHITFKTILYSKSISVDHLNLYSITTMHTVFISIINIWKNNLSPINYCIIQVIIKQLSQMRGWHITGVLCMFIDDQLERL
jgi:hypothetical protein